MSVLLVGAAGILTAGGLWLATRHEAQAWRNWPPYTGRHRTP